MDCTRDFLFFLPHILTVNIVFGLSFMFGPALKPGQTKDLASCEFIDVLKPGLTPVLMGPFFALYMHYSNAMRFEGGGGRKERGALVPVLPVSLLSSYSVSVCECVWCAAVVSSTSSLLSAELDFLPSVSGFIDNRQRHG